MLIFKFQEGQNILPKNIGRIIDKSHLSLSNDGFAEGKRSSQNVFGNNM